MKKPERIYSHTILFIVIIIAFFSSVPVYSAAKCGDCTPSTKPETEQEKKYYDQWYTEVYDHTLDNPEDSTSKRISSLEFMFGYATLKDKTSKRITWLENILIDLILHDPYSCVRLESLRYFSAVKRYFPITTVVSTYKQALNDPCFPITFIASEMLLYISYNDSTIQLDPRANKIIFDSAAGAERSTWNVNGLFPKKQLMNNPEIIETERDNYQKKALEIIRVVYKRGYDLFLDSVYQNGATEEIRKGAKRAKDQLFK